MLLGDRISEALGRIGITQERVSRWIGVPCGCKERQAKLNALEIWARRVLAGKIDKARQYLAAITGEEYDP